jgi:hypothetical protein
VPPHEPRRPPARVRGDDGAKSSRTSEALAPGSPRE